MKHHFRKNKHIYAGLILQLVVGFLWYNGDIANYVPWGNSIVQHGPVGLYDRDFTNQLLSNANYPPFMMAMCALVALAVENLKNIVLQLNFAVPLFPSALVPFFQTEYPGIYIFKMLIVGANVLVAKQLSAFVVEELGVNKKHKPTIEMGFLYNPVLIYATTVWGQIDILPFIFLIPAIRFAIHNKLPKAVFLFACALLTKQTILVFAPIFGIYIFFKSGILRSVYLAIFGVILIWAGYAPFSTGANVLEPIVLYLTKVQFASATTYATSSAMNMWVLFSPFKTIHDTTPMFLGITYRTAGLVITAFLYAFIAYRMYLAQKPTKQVGMKLFWPSLLAASFTAFLFLTRLHNRHLVAALPFTAIMIESDSSWKKIYFITSALIGLNLLYTWFPGRGDLADIIPWFVIVLGAVVTLGMYVFILIKLSRSSSQNSNLRVS